MYTIRFEESNSGLINGSDGRDCAQTTSLFTITCLNMVSNYNVGEIVIGTDVIETEQLYVAYQSSSSAFGLFDG